MIGLETNTKYNLLSESGTDPSSPVNDYVYMHTSIAFALIMRII